MKKHILSIIILFAALSLFAQTDRTKPPVSALHVSLDLGEYQTYKLKNGLTVILVENHKLPLVNFSLRLDFDPFTEGDQAGAASMAGSLLRTGTSTRTKQQIDQEIDFIGGSLSTSSGGIYGSSLKKHHEKLLDLMTDVLYNPSFPEEEFDKLKKQTLSGLQFNSTNAAAISSTVSQVLRYGKEHPYGEVTTEETVENITLDGIRNFYENYFRPNIAYLIMVGDLTLKESKNLSKKYFEKWEERAVPKHTYPTPEPPEGVKVAFVDKPGAVQSVISITYPVLLKPGTSDVIPAMLMNNILGGGVFSGRLMLNLREDKAYTYGATSSLSSDRLVGSFSAGAQVGNSVTDSAITEFLYEMKRLISEPLGTEDIQMNKNIVFGQFARALESPQTVANFALNTIRYNLPKDYYSSYLEILNKVDAGELQTMAAKYLKPDHCYIIVVGNKGEVAEKLVKFASTGKVDYFDRYGNPLEESKNEVPLDMTAEKVISRYIEVSGGEDAMSNIERITMHAKGLIQAMGQQAELNITRYQEAPNKICMLMEMQGMNLSTQVYDGEKGFIKSMQGNQDLSGNDLEQMKYDSYIFPELFYGDDNYTLEIKGVEKINGEDAVALVITNPAGKSQTEFFSLNTGLKVRVIIARETPQGLMESVIDYADFKKLDGVVFPFKMVQQVGPQTITIEVEEMDTKSEIDPAVFKK